MAIDLNDKTANGNNLTNVGATEINSTLPFIASSVAVDLEASESDYLYAADSASLSFTGDFSIECWVKFESLPSSDLVVFVAKYEDTGPQRSWIFGLRDASGLKLELITSSDGTTIEIDRVDWVPSTGVWYHVAVTYDNAGTIKFYVNGTQQGADQTASNTSIFNSTARVSIGAFNTANTPAQFLDGQLDEIRIWDDVRTQTEIENNKVNELAGNEANLVAYWPFDPLSLTPGTNSHAIDLERSSTQYLSITDGSQTGLDLSGDFTIAGWFRTEDNSVPQAIVSKGNYNTNSRAYTLYYRTSSSRLEMLISSNGTTYDQVSVSWTPTNNQFYHIAVTCDVSNSAATEFEFFVDGVSLGNGSVGNDGSVSSINNSADPFYIGAENGVATAENMMDGTLDEIVVTSDILTPAEIIKLYQGFDASTFLDNLKGYWKLNNALTDSSGNGNTLTNNGTAVFVTNVPFANYAAEAANALVIIM